MRIGILGGTFDPPHVGHIEMARLCEEFLNLDQIFFVPANQQWQKDHETSADVRSHMTNLAIASHPNWSVSNVDIERSGDTFSIDTWRDFRNYFPNDELFFILGSDAANGLSTWKSAEELKREASFAVLNRFGIESKISSDFNVEYVPGEVPDVSSTYIRSIAKNSNNLEKELSFLVPSAVAKYIATVGLYK